MFVRVFVILDEPAHVYITAAREQRHVSENSDSFRLE
jgi:hypothetical protein